MQNDPLIEAELIAGHKIQAIQRYRDGTGASLRDALNVINERESALRASGRMPATGPPFVPPPFVIRLLRFNLWLTVVLVLFVALVLGVVMMFLLKVGSALG